MKSFFTVDDLWDFLFGLMVINWRLFCLIENLLVVVVDVHAMKSNELQFEQEEGTNGSYYVGRD